MEREEAAELAVLLAREVRRLELLRDSGLVDDRTVLIARIEDALARLVLASPTERWRLLRTTDDWVTALRRQMTLLHEAGRIPRSELDETERALTGLREGERWWLSPLRLLPEAPSNLQAVPVPSDGGEGIGDVRARHLRRQVAVLAEATEPDLAIRRLLLRARLGETSFEVARAEAKKQLDLAPQDERADLEALVALFDWYGWPRLRDLGGQPK